MTSAPVTSATLASLRSKVGEELGESGWHVIDQSRIDAFADTTEDGQFIHVDAQRAREETPFGGTIAHGFLCLSMLSRLSYEALAPLQGQVMSMNYGFNQIRFLSTVPSGARIRGRFALQHLDEQAQQRVRLTYGVTIEIEGQERPALVAQWIVLVLMKTL